MKELNKTLCFYVITFRYVNHVLNKARFYHLSHIYCFLDKIYKSKIINMKKLILLTIMSLSLMACNVKKEESGDLPEVDVDIDTEAGELPEYEVNWADVDVGTTTKMVEVPKVVIVMEEEEVEVPYIDVDMPDGDDREKSEKTLMVEAEVTDNEHELDIKEIWAAKNNLYVIAELEETDQDIGDKKMRVSDQVSLNAPDLNVKYYIIGERPDRVFNTQYTYLKNADELKSKLDNPKKIY